MPYYLAPYIQDGVLENRAFFRPRGSDQAGWSAIDLRPDGGATLGGGGLNACLLHLPIPDPDPQLRQVALAPADTIGPVLRQAIVTRLNLLADPVSTRWDDLAMELLLGPPPNGWKAIRATVNRQYDVWLGGLLKRLPVVSGGVSISENWNCADSASLTCQLTWTELNVEASWAIVSNQAKLADASGNQQFARADSDLAGADHSAQGTITLTKVTSYVHGGAVCRIPSDGTITGYNFRGALESFPNDNKHYLYKTITNSNTLLGTDETDVVNGEVVKVEADGSNITGYINGVASVGPITDSAITGNLRCGIVGYTVGAGDTAIIDDWSAADLAAAGAAQFMVATAELANTGGMVGRRWQ